MTKRWTCSTVVILGAMSLGVEPLPVMKAYQLGGEDPPAEVLAVLPDATVDEAWATHWEGNREWGRRLAPR